MWTPEYFVRLVSLPLSVEGVSIPNDDGTFDIYINADLCESRQRDCLDHEIKHITEDHFYQEAKSVAQLEAEAGAPATADTPTTVLPVFPSLQSLADYLCSGHELPSRKRINRQTAV